jgi:hypothetical protein
MSIATSPMNHHAMQTIQTTEYGLPAEASPISDVSDPFAAGLTSDDLLAYCQSRLDSIDDQVRASFDAQQRSADDVAKINGVIGELRNASSADVKGQENCEKLETTLGSAIQDLQNSDPTCPALPGMITTYNSMVYSGTGGPGFAGPQFIDPTDHPPNTTVSKQGDNDLSTNELQSYTQNLTDAAASINSNSELEMIHLQSLMAQRQTAISLTTNLVQSLGDQQNKIAENIGH